MTKNNTKKVEPHSYSYPTYTQPVTKSYEVLETGFKSAFNELDSTLYELLSLGCPSGEEKPVADKIIEYVEPHADVTQDEHGNIIVQVGEQNSFMFTSHMDTVHSNYTDVVPFLTEEQVCYGYEKVSGKEFKRCVLGADDKLGIWIMLNMIWNQKQGTYVFFVEEESGRQGSIAMRKDNPEWLSNIKYCISFDRKGFNEIITKQRGSICASDLFAESLAIEINKGIDVKMLEDFGYIDIGTNMYGCSQVNQGDFTFKASPNGSYTDSASFTDIIPECTNIAVGYDLQHSSNEEFDWFWLSNVFMPAWMQVDFNNVKQGREFYKCTDTCLNLHNTLKSVINNKSIRYHTRVELIEKQIKDVDTKSLSELLLLVSN